MAANSGGRKTAACLKCKITVKKDDLALKCDGFCESWFHIGCVDVSKEIYEDINKICDEIMWMCGVCKKHLKNFKIISGLASKSNENVDLEQSIIQINNNIEALQTTVETQKLAKHNLSYAEIIELGKDSKPSRHKLKGLQDSAASNEKTLVIKPKQTKKSEDVEIEIKSKINPVTAQAPIKYFKITKRGVVIIKSDSVNNVDKLKQHAEKALDDSYTIELQTQNNPRLKIVGLNKDYKHAEELIDDLKILNSKLFCAKDKMIIKFSRQSQVNKKWTVFVEADGHTFAKLVNTKLDLGWGYCSIYEDLSIRRCKKCCGYNHKTSECRNEQKCPCCAGDHESKRCPNKENKQCINCIYVKQKFDATRDTNHTSDSEDCPIYVNKVKMAQEKINYFTKLE